MDVNSLIQCKLDLTKKFLQAKANNDKLQAELRDTKSLYSELENNHNIVKDNYISLQKKYQIQFIESNKNNQSLIHQIQQLKQLIDRKENELQNIQLKMIPNLDQDMIRVKLIAEMEGPYQEIADKKDKEIFKLKENITKIQRNMEILQLTLSNKTKLYNQQIQQTKLFYQNQNQKLSKELNHFMAKQQIKTQDKNLAKRLHKELEDLRYTLQLDKKRQYQLQESIQNLKYQRETLLNKIENLNNQRILILQNESLNPQIKALKAENSRLEEQLYAKKTQIEQLQRKTSALQKQKHQQHERLKEEADRNKRQFQEQIKSLQEEVRQSKDDLRRVRESNRHQEGELETYIEKCSILRRQLGQKTRECEILLEYKGKYEERQVSERGLRKQQINRFEQARRQASPRDKKVIQSLKNKITKLEQKLQYANKKIVQLIRNKMDNSPQGRKRSTTDHNANHPPYHSKKNAFLLQFRDSSLIPLVQPTIYTHIQ